MRRAFAAIVALLALPTFSAGETIHLKGGGRVSGTIIERDESSVKVSVPLEKGSAIVTLARTRIDRIEEATTLAQRLETAAGLLARGEFAKAEEGARELLKMDPRHAGARRVLADALYGQYRPVEATRTLEHYETLATGNRDPGLLMQLAQYHLEAANYREARRVARETADLYPENRELAAQADEFLKRVERVRTGAEQVKERETAEKAEIRKRREERAKFDKQLGNNRDAQLAAEMLQTWTADSATGLRVGVLMDVGAPDEAINEYQAGADETWFREKVTKALATVRVDESRWTGMFDHEKAMYLYGWHYQLRARYPRANPVVTAVCTVREGGQEKDKTLARATWDGRKQQVTIDRFTRENRDPSRPVRRVIR